MTSATNTTENAQHANDADPDVLSGDVDLPARSDIVLLYDAVDCNPNGDPLSANDMPRIDRYTREAIVTDVRLKRYLRDQFYADGHDILVKRPDQIGRRNAPPRELLYRLINGELEIGAEEVAADEASMADYMRAFFDHATDVRHFGAALSIGGDDASDEAQAISAALPRTLTGPVQFAQGRSLNPVTVNDESKGLTTVISSSGEDEDNPNEQGTFAEDNRIRYGLIGFDGIINEAMARYVRFSADDAEQLGDTFWRALKSQTLSRSKFGQQPRLYLRVQYEDGQQLGGLRRSFEMVPRDGINHEEVRSIADHYVNAERLIQRLTHKSIIDRIAGIELIVSPELCITVDGIEPAMTDGPSPLIDALTEQFGEERLDASTKV